MCFLDARAVVSATVLTGVAADRSGWITLRAMAMRRISHNVDTGAGAVTPAVTTMTSQ